jgi:KaiC/GvpD/RAD55 family RecA-like ATPase
MRVKTGIPGLDELMEGGFPAGSCVLVSGKIGTGKSIFAMQYIVKGITDFGEPGVFVSLEREKKALYQDFQRFGWQLQRLEKEGSLQLLGGPLASLSRGGRDARKIISEMVKAVEASESKRLAVDGMELLSMLPKDEFALWVELDNFKERLREVGCTSVLTSEIREGREELSRLGVEEEIADGVIVLYYEGEGLTRDRALEIRKMRGTEHSNQLHFFDITSGGIVLKKMPEKPKVPRGGRASGPPI